MNKKPIQVISFTITMLFFAFLGSLITQKCSKPKEVIKYEKQIDTLRIEVKKIERVVEYKTRYREKLKEQEKLIVFDTITCKEIVDNLKGQLANCDSIIVYKDNIIEKERTIIEYKDKTQKKPFVIGGGIEKSGNEYPFNLNAGFKIKNTIILGTVNTKGEVGVKALYNF